MVIAAADGSQGQPGGVAERQAVTGLDDRIPHGFGESGVLERLQHHVLRGLEEAPETAQDRKRQDVFAVGLAWHDTAQVSVCCFAIQLCRARRMKPWCGVSFVTQVITGRAPGRTMHSRYSYPEPSLFSTMPDVQDMAWQTSN